MDLYDFLKDKINDKKLILFGEVHGTKEIPLMLSEFFIRYSKDSNFSICLEISLSYQKNINEYLSYGDEGVLKDIFIEKSESDGRKTLEYLNLIKQIRKINSVSKNKIEVFCVDIDETADIETIKTKRDEIIAKTILKQKEKVFAVLGNFHSSKTKLKLGDKLFIPAGKILFDELKDKFVNINLVPKSGSFYNLGVKKINNFDSLNFGLYDYVFNIEVVTPATLIKG